MKYKLTMFKQKCGFVICIFAAHSNKLFEVTMTLHDGIVV